MARKQDVQLWIDHQREIEFSLRVLFPGSFPLVRRPLASRPEPHNHECPSQRSRAPKLSAAVAHCFPTQDAFSARGHLRQISQIGVCCERRALRPFNILRSASSSHRGYFPSQIPRRKNRPIFSTKARNPFFYRFPFLPFTRSIELAFAH
jgi:hypothetical protein